VLPWGINFLTNNDVIMGLQDNGAIHVRRNGTAYNVCGGDGVDVMPGLNKDSYYCELPGLTVFATTDDFKHTINVSPAKPAHTGVPGASRFSPFANDPTDRNHLMAAASGVWESTAGTNTNVTDPVAGVLLSTAWVNVFNPPPVSDPADGNLPMDASAVSATGPFGYVAFCDQCRPSLGVGPAINDLRHVHAEIGTNVQNGCTAKKAASACWHLAENTGLPHEQVSGIAIDPHDARTIYVSLRQFSMLGADPHTSRYAKVMVSHDAGDHFTDLTGDLPGADAHAIVYRDGQLYVASDVGVFTSEAGSASWSRFGTALPAVPFRSMTLSGNGRYLGLGAYGRGGYVYDFGAAAKLPPTVVPKLPGARRLATTGLDPGWPIFGVALLLLTAIRHRRRHASSGAPG
jgi:hypothetical protein